MRYDDCRHKGRGSAARSYRARMAGPMFPSLLTIATTGVRQRRCNLPTLDATAIMAMAAFVVLLAVAVLFGGVVEALALGLTGFMVIVALLEVGHLATACSSASGSSVSSGEAGGRLPLARGPAAQEIEATRGQPPRQRSQGSDAGAGVPAPICKTRTPTPGKLGRLPATGAPRTAVRPREALRNPQRPSADQPRSGDEVDWVRALIKGDHRFHKEKREHKRPRVLLAECGPVSGIGRRGGGPR